MTSRYEKAKNIYNEKGIKKFTHIAFNHLKFRLGFSKAYQEDRLEGIDQRWREIEPYLETNTSVLDIGCNVGILTSRAAEKTGCAIGVEPSWTAIERARKKHAKVSGVAFAQNTINAQNVDSLPSCDTIFLLSVYHLWHQQNDPEDAKNMLETVAEKASQQFFFEPASRKSRYDDQKLPFEDFNEKEIIEYNRTLLNDVLSSDWEVNYLGKTKGREAVDGFRCLFQCVNTY